MIDRDQLQKRMEWLNENSLEAQQEREEEARRAAERDAADKEEARREALGPIGRLQEDIEAQEARTEKARDKVSKERGSAALMPTDRTYAKEDLHRQERRLMELYLELSLLLDPLDEGETTDD